MISANQIHDVVQRYLAGDDADKFVLEFSALAHNIHKNGDQEAIELVHKIQSKIADVYAKAIGILELKDFLRASATPQPSGMYIRSRNYYTSSSAVPMYVGTTYWDLQGAASGQSGYTQPASVYTFGFQHHHPAHSG